MGFREIFTARGAKEPLSSAEDLPGLLRSRAILAARWLFFHDTDDDTDKVRTPGGDLVSLGGAGGGGLTPVSQEFAFEDVQAIWDYGTASSQVFEMGGESGTEIKYTATFPGTDGNSITIQHRLREYVDPGGGADMPLTVEVADLAITVNLAVAIDAPFYDSTAADVIEAVNLDGPASGLVTAELLSGSGDTLVPPNDDPIPLENGAAPGESNFLPLITLSEGQLFTVWPTVSEGFNNASDRVHLGHTSGENTVGSGAEWDLSQADNIDEAGFSYSAVINGNLAFVDQGVGWPVTITGELQLGLVFANPGGSGFPPDQGAGTIWFLVLGT